MVGSRFLKFLLFFITHLMGKWLKIRMVRLTLGKKGLIFKERNQK